MGALLRTWWPVMLLVWLPSLVGSVVTVVLSRAFRRLDESHPDDLPLTAGEWLEREIDRVGLTGWITSIVTDGDSKSSTDAYHPQHGVIQLSAETYFKRDPMHWAIAAHELGHARFKKAMPLAGRAIILAAFVKRGLIALATALMFGNVLFALPNITGIALRCFEIALGLQFLVLLDEAVASTLALRSLRASPEIGPRQMRSARSVLALAFSTYATTVAVYGALMTQWHLVEDVTRTPAVPPIYHLTTVGIVIAGVTTVIAGFYAINRLYLAFRPGGERALPIAKHDMVHTIIFEVALVVFVYLVWNHRVDASWAFMVMGALVRITDWCAMVIAIPGNLVDFILFDRLRKKLVVDPTHRTTELKRDHEAGFATRKAGNVAFLGLIERAEATPLLEHRVRELLRLSYVPLIVAFWLG